MTARAQQSRRKRALSNDRVLAVSSLFFAHHIIVGFPLYTIPLFPQSLLPAGLHPVSPVPGYEAPRLDSPSHSFIFHILVAWEEPRCRAAIGVKSRLLVISHDAFHGQQYK